MCIRTRKVVFLFGWSYNSLSQGTRLLFPFMFGGGDYKEERIKNGRAVKCIMGGEIRTQHYKRQTVVAAKQPKCKSLDGEAT